MQNDLADGDDTVLRPRGVSPVVVPDGESTVLRPRGTIMPPLPDGEDTVITARDMPRGLPEGLERTTARVAPPLVDSAPDEDTVLVQRVPRGAASPQPLAGETFVGPPPSSPPASGPVPVPTSVPTPAPTPAPTSLLAPLPGSEPDISETIIRGATALDALDDTIIRGVRGPAAPPALVAPPEQPPAVPVYVRHYRFRVNQHETAVPLDRPAYVGRKPSTPRIHSGDVPRLVKVASPLQEVSSTHLEVRQRGDSVIVTDLQSTNGTTVMIPGSAPRKLRQGESLVVSPGTLVDIGDGNIIEILPIQRLL